MKATFEWDERKNQLNIAKHGVTFMEAQQAFLDPERIILQYISHSCDGERFYCLGRVDGMVMTMCFTYRGKTIRIFGAGYWRKGRKIYEKT